jgi:hypothetical protein
MLPVYLPNNDEIIQSQRFELLGLSEEPEAVGTQAKPEPPYYEI